jgi:hypothetical protein
MHSSYAAPDKPGGPEGVPGSATTTLGSLGSVRRGGYFPAFSIQ